MAEQSDRPDLPQRLIDPEDKPSPRSSIRAFALRCLIACGVFSPAIIGTGYVVSEIVEDKIVNLIDYADCKADRFTVGAASEAKEQTDDLVDDLEERVTEPLITRFDQLNGATPTTQPTEPQLATPEQTPDKHNTSGRPPECKDILN